MPFAVKPLIKKAERTLTLSPSPCTSDGWDDASLFLFHHWAIERFLPGNVYYHCVMASVMDVHRVIANEWIAGLIYTGRAKTHRITVGSSDNPEICAFELLPTKDRMKVTMRMAGLDVYDPWEDREHDDTVAEALLADHYIDRFYDVFVNEYYFLHRKPRKRPDKSTFVPIVLSGHPRYENTSQKNRWPTDQAPPIEWRRIIEEVCSA